MGKTQSKEVDIKGDPQIAIINTQGDHTEKLEDLHIKIWCILLATAANLAINLYRLYTKNKRKEAVKTAKSIANLVEVVSREK